MSKGERIILWTAAGVLFTVLTTKKIVSMIDLPKKQRFKIELMPTALVIKQRYGIDPLITLTQAAQESNWGQSELTVKANNLYGFTATNDWLTAGKPIFLIQTKEYSQKPPEKIRYWNRLGDVKKKKPDGKGGSILMVEVDFRRYTSWQESVVDWALKISTLPRYKQAYESAKKGDVFGFAKSVSSAGYATDPSYSDKIVQTASMVKRIPIETA